MQRFLPLLWLFIPLAPAADLNRTVASAAPLTQRHPMTVAAIDARLTKKHFHGFMLVVRQGQVLLSKGYGQADATHHVPNTIHTKFPAWGFDRGFDAVAFMQLQARGKVSFHDKICTFLPRCPKYARSVTIYHLLTHSSGQKEFNPVGAYGNTSLRASECINLPIEFRPGTQTNGGGCDSFLLSFVLSRVMRQPWETVMRMLVWGPAGMRETGRLTNALKPPARMESYNLGNDPHLLANYSGSYLPYTTAADLLRFDQALISGKILSRTLLHQMFAPRLLDNPGQPGPKVFVTYGWYTTKDVGSIRQEVFASSDGFYSTDTDLFSVENKSAVVFYNNDPGYFNNDSENSFVGSLAPSLFGQ